MQLIEEYCISCEYIDEVRYVQKARKSPIMKEKFQSCKISHVYRQIWLSSSILLTSHHCHTSRHKTLLYINKYHITHMWKRLYGLKHSNPLIGQIEITEEAHSNTDMVVNGTHSPESGELSAYINAWFSIRLRLGHRQKC